MPAMVASTQGSRWSRSGGIGRLLEHRRALPGADQGAGQAAERDVPDPRQELLPGDGRQRRRQPGIEAALALPQADQERKEKGGEGEVEARARRVPTAAPEDRAARGWGGPAGVRERKSGRK